MNETSKKNLLFLGAIVAQIVVIFIIIIFKFSISASGESVLLHIVPVDPHDMLRGNYLVFQYDISNIDKYYFPPNIYNGETVYVGVIKQGPYFEFSQVSTSLPPHSFGSPIYIKGKIVSGAEDKGDIPEGYIGRGPKVRITYDSGEQFFIQEGTGDRLPPVSDSSALLKVDDSGRAVLTKVYVNGKEWGK